MSHLGLKRFQEAREMKLENREKTDNSYITRIMINRTIAIFGSTTNNKR